MDFSDQWRSLFPVPSVFPSPALFLASSSVGPLHLFPSHLQLHILLRLPPLQIPPPLPSPFHLSSLRSFFSSSAFLPYSHLSSLASDLLASPVPSPSRTIPFNLLCSLPSRCSPSAALLFFPSGDNSHSIASLRVSFSGHGAQILGPKPTVQSDGFKHPFHRIFKLSAASASDHHCTDTDVVVEGFLMSSTLYSVNWFRVETGVDRLGEVTSMVPVAKKGFKSTVIDAQLCASWPEVSVVLLESGELYWFDLEEKGSKNIVVCEGLGGWLGCEFGGQPWIILVACTSAVVAVDLRAKEGSEPKVLVRMQAEDDDRILAFCKSSYNDFHVAVVMERRLLLFDTRQPLVPVLTWDHGLHGPCYVSVFRLADLRPSEEFKWASDSGYIILVGSFWTDEFSLFSYGPREGRDAFDSGSVFYAWEIPLGFSLSGRSSGSTDKLVKNINSTCLDWKRRKDVVAGFWIVPNDRLKVESEYGGFALVRLMLSGKLEMQMYHASWKQACSESYVEGGESQVLDVSVTGSSEQSAKSSYTRYYSLNIGHLWEYMNGLLSSVMVMHRPQMSYFRQRLPSNHVAQIRCVKLESSSSSISTEISDATVPTNIFEITSRRVLNNLEMEFLPLAFSSHSLLFGNHKEGIALLKVPKCLPHHSSTPFFLVNPSLMGKKSKEVPYEENLVGPVFPVPVLLLLQSLNQQNLFSHTKDEPSDDLLLKECQTTLENVYPAISLADNECSPFQALQTEKSFFIYEKPVICTTSTCKGSKRITGYAEDEELPQTECSSLESENKVEDEKFTTFICGIADKAQYPSSGDEAAGFEMFDRLNPYKLDFDSPSIIFHPKEKELYKRLTRQSRKWLAEFKPHEEFCISSNIPKSP